MMNFRPIQKGIIENKDFKVIEENQNIDFFVIQTANECIEIAKSQPRPKMLFSEFWHEGELSILFADTNVGKSILAVQIADCISNGRGFRGFKVETTPQKVLLFDFELSQKQFEKRYSNDFSDHFVFHQNLMRAYINPENMSFDDFEKMLLEELEKAILKTNAKVVIIDNITYLKTQSTETAKEALPLMKTLKYIKNKYNLSILALAHTPKRNMFNPITVNDLAGSKHLANFVDSVFAIGTSQKDKSIRYLKQIKARATEKIYDHDNVVVCEICNPLNFLGFNFISFGKEYDHLKQQNQKESDELENAIVDLKFTEPNLSLREIATKLETNQMRVKRVLDRHFAK